MRPISDPLSAINCTGAPPPAMPSTFTRRSTSGRVATPNMRVTRVMWTETTRRRRSRSWTLSATNVGTTSGTTDAQDGTEKDFPLLKPNFSVVSFKYTHDIYPNYFCFCCFWGSICPMYQWNRVVQVVLYIIQTIDKRAYFCFGNSFVLAHRFAIFLCSLDVEI